MKLFFSVLSIFGLIQLVHSASVADTKGPNLSQSSTGCLQVTKFDFNEKSKYEVAGGLSGLKKQLGDRTTLVAHSVETIVDGSGSNVSIEQRFSGGNKEEKICGRIGSSNINVNFFAPTVIDLSTAAEKSMNASTWQFDTFIKDGRVLDYSHHSHIMTNSKIEKVLAQNNADTRFYHTSENRVYLVISRQENGMSQQLVIRYDVSR